MSQYYLRIFADLMEVTPTSPIILPDPYLEEQTLDSNVRRMYKLIRWSVKSGDRIGVLVFAFYLGYLLEERASTPAERRQCREALTPHYIRCCTRVYNLYSISGIQQIYRSQRTDYWMFQRLSRPEYKQLIQDALNIF